MSQDGEPRWLARLEEVAYVGITLALGRDRTGTAQSQEVRNEGIYSVAHRRNHAPWRGSLRRRPEGRGQGRDRKRGGAFGYDAGNVRLRGGTFPRQGYGAESRRGTGRTGQGRREGFRR